MLNPRLSRVSNFITTIWVYSKSHILTKQDLTLYNLDTRYWIDDGSRRTEIFSVTLHRLKSNG